MGFKGKASDVLCNIINFIMFFPFQAHTTTRGPIVKAKEVKEEPKDEKIEVNEEKIDSEEVSDI